MGDPLFGIQKDLNDPFRPSGGLSGAGGVDAPGKHANALILCYDKKYDGMHAYAAADFKKTLEKGGMRVTTLYQFSADDLRHMAGYDYIEAASLGAKYCGYPCRITGQKVNCNVLNHYSADMRKWRVVATCIF